ncbi:MAG: xanthine dehydrogenase family protein molybdopterin-binding subunit, partial [Anaerolineae bacterium]
MKSQIEHDAAGDGFEVVGRRCRIHDGREKVTGQVRYATDLTVPGMLHARLVLSPYAHARILNVDTRPAENVPGVVRVVTGADLADLRVPPSSRARALLATDRVIFAGHPVAVVLAEDEATAEDGADAVFVDYQPLPSVVDPLEAMEPNAPLVWPNGLPSEDWSEAGMHGIEEGGDELEHSPSNVSSMVHFTRGDVEAGFRQADVVLEHTYRTPMVHQSYLEPHATVAAPDPLSDGMTIWTSTQSQFYVRSEVAGVLGVRESRVRVVPTPVGGAFGGKFVLTEPLVAVLARMTGRPVRLVLTRSEEFLTATPAPQGIIDVKIGARRDGTLTALQARIVFDSGAWPATPVSIAGLLLGGYYRVPNLAIAGIEVLTHKPAAGAYRAPGATQATLAIESSMDELARALERCPERRPEPFDVAQDRLVEGPVEGMDPIQLRLHNACDEGDPMPNDRPWPRIGLKACLERLREHPAWRETQRRPYHGVGIAVGGWPGGVQPAAATCQLNADGRLTVSVGSIDITGTHTGFAAIAAEAFGVTPDRVHIVAGDTAGAPYAGGSGGSKITYTVGTAVMRAAAEAREQVLSVAADHLEARPDDLEISDGWVQVRGVPDRRVSLAELGEMSRRFGGRYEPIFGHGRSAITDQAPGFAAHLAEVAVDPETGVVRVVRYVAVQDVGRAINPLTVEGQMHGGAAQSIGWALCEEMLHDKAGNLLTGTLMDYAMPAIHDVPPIETHIIEVPSPSGPFGARGVGEPPVIPGAAAIANAIRDAT